MYLNFKFSSSLSDNISNQRGGAIYLENSYINTDNIVIKDNSSSKDGAAAYVDGSVFDFFYTNINSNFCDENGGGFYIQNSEGSIENSYFNDNIASDVAGALYLKYTDINILNSEFSDNESDEYGGAINIKQGNIEINNVYFIRMNLFKLFFAKNFFDVIISNGVLHHTNNPKEAFIALTKYLKKDGYIIIGLYHKYGRIFTNFQQFIIKNLGDRFNFLDRRSTDNNLSSEKKYAWFNDQFKNPKESSHTYVEILDWFYQSGIEFISSINKFPQ